MCGRLRVDLKFTSKFTGLSYQIRHRLDCKSKFCVYLVTCDKCGCQYTGSTVQHMHLRHGGHRQEVREESSPLGRDFAQCGVEMMLIQIIDCVRTDLTNDNESREALRYLEGVWKNRLATMAEHGNINHVDEITARENRIPGTIRNLLKM